MPEAKRPQYISERIALASAPGAKSLFIMSSMFGCPRCSTSAKGVYWRKSLTLALLFCPACDWYLEAEEAFTDSTPPADMRVKLDRDNKAHLKSMRRN